MVSLVDIAASKGTVTLRGQEVDVNGLTAEHVAEVFYQFPEVRKMLTTGTPGVEIVQSLVSRIPEAAGLIVALGTGADASDKKALEKASAAARALVLGEQYELIKKIVDLTFPGGIQSFVDGVMGVLGQASPGALGWAPGTTSPAQSNSASRPEEASETAGDQPQGS